MAQTPNSTEKADIRQDPFIVVPAAALLLLVVLLSVKYPDSTEAFVRSLYDPFAAKTGMIYLWITFIMIVLSIYFSCSRYGNIRFGEPNVKPEFSDVAWYSLMFSTGVAGAVLFWSIVEPLFHLSAPPQYLEPLSRDAFDFSLAYVLFHWGPVTWPWYAVTALPICYLIYRKNVPVLRISAVAQPILGKKASEGPIGKIIEICFIVGLIFSNTAVMGVSIPIVAESFSALTGWPVTFAMQAYILGISTILFTISVSLGLKVGIKYFSYVNAIIAILMVGYALLVGPTSTILNNFTNAFGIMANNFFKMLFWTAPWQKSTFPQDWTIFYALWMASYGPFMGLFIARISRGRTVRQVLLMSIFGGIAGSYFIHGIFGSYTLYVQHAGIVDAVEILRTEGGPAALIAVLTTLPMREMILCGYIAFSTIFLATSVDSAAYILAACSTRRLTTNVEPSLYNRFFWAFIQGGLALSVICLGGMGAAKIFGNFAGLFMLFPISFALISWFKFVRCHDMHKEERLEREAKERERAAATADCSDIRD